MRRIQIAISSLCLAVLSAPVQRPESLASIQGVVSEAGTDRPLEHVWVALIDVSKSQTEPNGDAKGTGAFTDAQGKFQFETSPGRFRLIPDFNGYTSTRPNQLQSPTEPGVGIRAIAGQAINVSLQMVRESVVSGRVLDADGHPAVNATVSLLRYRYDEYGVLRQSPISSSIASFGSTRSNDLGEYRLFGLQSGEYVLSIGALGGSIYYPGTPDIAKAAPIQVGAGTELTLGNMSLPPREKRTPIRLQLTLEGMPLSPDQATIRLRPGRSTINVFGQNRSDVSFSLPQGHYDLVVSAVATTDYISFIGDVTIEVGQEPEIYKEVPMKRSYKQSVTYAMQDGAEQRSAPRGIDCKLRPENPSDPIIGCTGNSYASGTYFVEIQGLPRDAYVKSAAVSGIDVLQEGIQIRGDIQLNITLVEPGATLNGKVLDAAGILVPHAAVALVPIGIKRSVGPWYRAAVADADGTFELRGIAPGNYQLFGWTEIEGAAYRNEDFINSSDSHAKPIVVENNEQLSVNVEIADTPRDRK